MIRFIGWSMFFFVGTLLNQGCSILPKNQDIPVTYFDIGFPSKIDTPSFSKLTLKDVKTIAPYNERMVFRASENHIKIDDYNLWVTSPNEIFKKYIFLAFQQNNINHLQAQKTEQYDLFIQILCLESNLKKKSVKVTILIELKDPSNGELISSEILSDEQTINNVSAENFAITVKFILDKMLSTIGKQLNK